MENLTLIASTNNKLFISTHICNREDWSVEVLDEIYGIGNWVITPSDELPSDFAVDSYTIADGALAPASADVIASRQAARFVAERNAIRAQRESRYNSEAISSLYWDWIESGLDVDRIAWISAKDAVRAELPYPEPTESKYTK